jgi:(E)-4-hydroxy-3-methylbut-2-enyl-diphosphate synthase
MSKHTVRVDVGGVAIGAGAPVAIQSMLTRSLSDGENALDQIRRLRIAGCEIARAAVANEGDAQALSRIAPLAGMPIVADIHFNHSLAISAAKNGAAKIRINPGNIGSEAKVREVVACLKDLGIPIRIGVNSGSLERDLLEKHSGPSAAGMLESAERHLAILERAGFENTVVSLKSSDVALTVEACRLFDARHDYPQHLGVTEAGSGSEGLVNSAVGIGALLLDGIGDTIRVSLTGDPLQEVPAAKAILAASGARRIGIRVVSCPTCARCRVDLGAIAQKVKDALSSIDKPLTVAVMGCAVNGPGEARHADVGVACGAGMGAIFVRGSVVESVDEAHAAEALIARVESMAAQAV